ncbi:efflux system membrane protein [Citrobacter freundii]|nr:efflux system membrane protein [Citrobacter freundii]
MSLFPVIVVFGLSFPPIFFRITFCHWRFSGWCAGYWFQLASMILSGTRLCFNTALYCCLFYLITRLFV